MTKRLYSVAHVTLAGPKLQRLELHKTYTALCHAQYHQLNASSTKTYERLVSVSRVRRATSARTSSAMLAGPHTTMPNLVRSRPHQFLPQNARNIQSLAHSCGDLYARRQTLQLRRQRVHHSLPTRSPVKPAAARRGKVAQVRQQCGHADATADAEECVAAL